MAHKNPVPKTDDKAKKVPTVLISDDPLAKPPNMPSITNKQSPLAQLEEVHAQLRVGGPNIQKSEDNHGLPRNPETTLKEKKGDCSELTNLMVAGMLSVNMDKNENVKIGGIRCHLKGKKEGEDHLLPIVLIKDPSAKGIEGQFADAARKYFGVSKDWKVLIPDPQNQSFTPSELPFTTYSFVDLNGLRSAYFEEVGIHFIRKNNQSSIPYLSRAIELDPKNSEAQYALSTVLNESNPEKAYESAKKAYDINKKEQKYAIALLDSIRFAANKASNERNFENALKLIEEGENLINGNPALSSQKSTFEETSRTIYYNAGVAAFNNKNKDDALKYLNKAKSLGLPQAQQAIDTINSSE